MVDTDTFLTTLYVMVDDFCKANKAMLPQERDADEMPAGPTRAGRGRAPSLCRSEVVCLAIFSQFGLFSSEHDFYRYARRHLLRAFPRLPHRTQLNRLVRRHYKSTTAFALHLSKLMTTQEPHNHLYEALDASAVPVRDARRRGVGWLPEYVNIGHSGRIGWYCGFHLLVSVTPVGVITGWGFSAASCKDQPLAESFFAARALPNPLKSKYICSAGDAAGVPYVADTGFEGRPNHKRWRSLYGAHLICPPHPYTQHRRWGWPLRRWLSSVRQVVESVYDKLHNFFALKRERPHDLTGFVARLAATMALHNFCIWLNRQVSRPHLAFADLLGW
jgi:hypothetical protein